jgi:two-component system, OmpR family, sensor kinase
VFERARRWARASGLRGRLALTIGAIVTTAAAVTFVAVYRGTGAQVRDQIQGEVGADVASLRAQLIRSGPAGPRATLRRARRSIAAEPAFTSSSRLFVVQVRGAGIATNEPELVGVRAPGSDETRGDRRRERGESAAIRAAPPGTSTVDLEDAGQVLLETRRASTGRGGASALVTAGEPLAPVDRAQDGVARTFLIAGSLTLLAALVAGVLAAARTAAPLRQMARTAAAVDAGELSHRMPERGPREIRQLAESFNHMLDRLEDAFARQRSFASDASHELRTPLTAIRGQIEVLARSPSPSHNEVEATAALVETEIARMDRLVGDLLLLAESDEGLVHRTEAIDPERFIAETVDGIALGSGRRVELGPAPHGLLVADGDRLAQVLRSVVRNAIEHTVDGGVIDVSAAASGGRLRVTVDDDGPGIPPPERERVFDRFHRTDASRARRTGGSGLGLAIARAIVEAHGGRIWATESPAGGARIVFDVPGFRSAPRVS